MKKLYLIFAVIFLLILSSCGLGEQPIEPSSEPEIPSQSETETSQPEEETPTESEQEPNLTPEHLLDFGDGLEYLHVDSESKIEMSASYLAGEILTAAIHGEKIESGFEMTPDLMDHILVMMYGSGLDGDIYDSFGNPYDKTKLPYTNWSSYNEEGGLRFDAATCAKIAYEVFGMEDFEFIEGDYGFTFDEGTGEYVTHYGFSPSADYAAYECKIAYPDEKNVAVRFVISNVFAWMGNEGWSYIGEGKMTFEIMQNESGEDFLRYKNFEYLPYETPIYP